MHLRWTDYEIWWLGADDKWRLAKTYNRPDRALEYVRRFHQEFPDVHVTVFKRWQIRHKMWEMKSDNPATVFPEVTKLEQLEINNGKYGSEDSETTGEGEHTPGSDTDGPDGEGGSGNDAGSQRCETVDQGARQ